ncbi:MAG: hypothetical protein Q7S00_00705, partial [bacterium]|nr:hypothetical protein [bacterium]
PQTDSSFHEADLVRRRYLMDWLRTTDQVPEEMAHARELEIEGHAVLTYQILERLARKGYEAVIGFETVLQRQAQAADSALGFFRGKERERRAQSLVKPSVLPTVEQVRTFMATYRQSWEQISLVEAALPTQRFTEEHFIGTGQRIMHLGRTLLSFMESGLVDPVQIFGPGKKSELFERFVQEYQTFLERFIPRQEAAIEELTTALRASQFPVVLQGITFRSTEGLQAFLKTQRLFCDTATGVLASLRDRSPALPRQTMKTAADKLVSWQALMRPPKTTGTSGSGALPFKVGTLPSELVGGAGPTSILPGLISAGTPFELSGGLPNDPAAGGLRAIEEAGKSGLEARPAELFPLLRR